MDLKRRIEALEGRLTPHYITLSMRDGSKARIRSGWRHLLPIVVEAMHRHHDESIGELVGPSEFDKELELIKKSIADDEEGQLISLARIALNSDPGDIRANRLDQDQGGDVGDE